MGCCNACPRGTMTNLTGVTRQLQNEKQCVRGEMERLNAAVAEKAAAALVAGAAAGAAAPNSPQA